VFEREHAGDNDLAKIMIVDDDRTTVMLLTTFLELEDFDVVNVPRGGMAMDKARMENPDAFLIDFRLQDMEGTKVISQLRAEPQFATTPIVMSSGMNIEDEALKVGANVFLVKPFEPGDLPRIFNDLIKANAANTPKT
jgi:DNA-binding response OmpR family regulator